MQLDPNSQEPWGWKDHTNTMLLYQEEKHFSAFLPMPNGNTSRCGEARWRIRRKDEFPASPQLWFMSLDTMALHRHVSPATVQTILHMVPVHLLHDTCHLPQQQELQKLLFCWVNYIEEAAVKFCHQRLVYCLCQDICVNNLVHLLFKRTLCCTASYLCPGQPCEHIPFCHLLSVILVTFLLVGPNIWQRQLIGARVCGTHSLGRIQSI